MNQQGNGNALPVDELQRLAALVGANLINLVLVTGGDATYVVPGTFA